MNIRPVPLLITDQQSPRLPYNKLIEVKPGDKLIRLPDCTYKFTCKFRGELLLINGREMKGELKQVLHPTEQIDRIDSDWSLVRCELKFPNEGIWRVIFWVDGVESAVQDVVAGESCKFVLTDVEKRALASQLPTSQPQVWD
jgi:hypothetical protein